MGPIEERVRASLHARAEDVEPTPHLYRGVQERIARRQRLRVGAWSLAGVAAVAAAVVVVPNLVPGLDPRPPEIADRPSPVESPEPPTDPSEPPTEAPSEGTDGPGAAGPFGDGVVVADDTTVTLVRPDGSTQELVTFPTEGESSVVDVAVRPGSTATDLVVALTTRAEGQFDVRWLRVVEGQVDPDPVGVGFPAPVVGDAPAASVGGFPALAPDLQDGGQPAVAWSPDGDLLAVVLRPAEGAPNEVRTIGWDEDGPSDDPNLAATFALDSDRPLTLRGWSWTDDAAGAAREGQLLLVDDLAREAFTTRFDRQADGAPAVPAGASLEPVEGAGVLDLADLDRDGSVDAVLRTADPVPVLELPSGVLGSPAGASIPLDGITGPRDGGFLAGSERLLLVVLDPAQPVLVDPETGGLRAAPVDGEVVSADLLG